MNVIVIGAGAAGLMAAITAARSGATVTILEQNDKPGRKILATGNGRCNLTNTFQDPTCYRGSDPAFAWAIIEQFPLADTLRFFTSLGIYTKNKKGWMYPYSEQAAAVLDVLLLEAGHQKVKIKMQEEVQSIVPQSNGFLVMTKTWQYSADRVIVTTGSPASTVKGSTDAGYRLAESLQHTLIQPLPALVSLRGVGDYFVRWAGVRMEGVATLVLDDKESFRTAGELQFTDYGLSGIPIFQLSRFAVRGLSEGKQAAVHLDLLPDFTVDSLMVYLQQRKKDCPYKTAAELLIGLIPAKMIAVLALNHRTLAEIASRLKQWVVPIKGAHSLEQAQVCAGGVKTSELNKKTLESKIIPGLYFAGEVVDVDGDCGGYNLQWAWSSGAVTGKYAALDEHKGSKI